MKLLILVLPVLLLAISVSAAILLVKRGHSPKRAMAVHFLSLIVIGTLCLGLAHDCRRRSRTRSLRPLPIRRKRRHRPPAGCRTKAWRISARAWRWGIAAVGRRHRRRLRGPGGDRRYGGGSQELW